MFWSSKTIERRQHSSKLIEPFDPKRLKHGAYELTLSHQVLATSATSNVPVSDGRAPLQKDFFEIPPGQFALLYATEYIHIPDDTIAFISIKASIKLAGLINISGFHVDPGFQGRLKFSVYNAGAQAIPLEYGIETFLIWFSELDCPTDPYDGNHKNQNRITSKDRQLLSASRHSPESLNIRLKFLEEREKAIRIIFFAFVVPVLLVFLKYFLDTARPLSNGNSHAIENVGGKPPGQKIDATSD